MKRLKIIGKYKNDCKRLYLNKVMSKKERKEEWGVEI